MKNEVKRNGIIIGILLITIALMTIGYAALATQLTIGEKNKSEKWNISFESITKNDELSTEDAIENNGPSATSTAVTFDVTIPNPGSKIVYDLVVQNTGTIDAIFKEVKGITEANQSEPTNIVYKIERLDSKNGKVATGTGNLVNTTGKNYFRLTIEWPNDAPSKTDNTSKINTIYIDYSQKLK